jgi:YidC/Oxa1 family membrane protein insertase
VQSERNGASVTTLSNSFVEVNFTDAGGAIRDVAFKKYPARSTASTPSSSTSSTRAP